MHGRMGLQLSRRPQRRVFPIVEEIKDDGATVTQAADITKFSEHEEG